MAETKECHDDRIESMERVLFGEKGENSLVRQVKDNTMLITEHIRECRDARAESKRMAKEDARERNRQFWSLLVAIGSGFALLLLSKLFG